jgi:hypothetical protein
MGKLIIEFENGRLESFKCKSKERAKRIISKRLQVIQWNYYEQNERIPQKTKAKEQYIPKSFEELDLMMKMQGLK